MTEQATNTHALGCQCSYKPLVFGKERNIALSARRGKPLSTGSWEAYLEFENGEELFMGAGYGSPEEALRTADSYRKRWQGESVKTMFVNASDDHYPSGRTGSAFVQRLEDDALEHTDDVPEGWP